MGVTHEINSKYILNTQFLWKFLMFGLNYYKHNYKRLKNEIIETKFVYKVTFGAKTTVFMIV